MARPINLKKIERRLVVRPLRPEDWASVVALEQHCLPGMETWTKDQFASRGSSRGPIFRSSAMPWPPNAHPTSKP